MNNVAITIDEKQCKLKALFTKDKSIAYREYSFSPDYIKDSVDYENIFSQTLDLFTSQENIYPASLVYVLQDNYVASDYVEIPSFAGKKLNDTLNLEISTRYKQIEQYKTTFVPMGDQGSKSAFIAFMIAQKTISDILSALKPYKFSSKNVTFESAMIANSFLLHRTLRRHDTVLLADVKNAKTKLVLIKDSKLAGFSELPYGEDLLDGQKLIAPPSILPTEQFYNKAATAVQLAQKEDGDNKGNIKYLLRTLLEMCDIFAARYHMDNIALKYNASKVHTPLFEGLAKEYKIEQINVKNPLIAEHLELYGALNTKLYNKGLLF
ncbi:MAG: hypothetical protein J1F36_06510 [Clostridiales bacterium]|nr:hypothetical protein [Clostridiales bacterium]